jgi:hypothetical protein
MKMVKGLLLGSAAGIVAVSGVAQAADLPVKAKPVEYVRICSIYGAGFYYIPGTDTCLKVGGFVFADYAYNAGGSHSTGRYLTNNDAGAGSTERGNPVYGTRVRGHVTLDARTQTEYGTLRAYINAGWELNDGQANYRGICSFSRAFIQFAGITAGKTQSFFAFYSNALNISTLQGGGHSDAGLNLLAYTAQFAGGFSATISVEDPRHHRAGIINANRAIAVGAFPGPGQGLLGQGDYKASVWPDIVANLRVDQPWGAAQIAGAVRDTSGSYYGVNPPGGAHTGVSAGLDHVGWAVSGGVRFNLPFAQGDQLWIQGTYAKGATNYLGFNPFVHGGNLAFSKYDGNAFGSVAATWAPDAVYSTQNGGQMALVEGWSVLAAFIHYWTPSVRTAVFGHYTHLDFGNRNSANTAANILCNNLQAAGGAGQNLQVCNPNWSIWQVGQRTTWSPVRNLDIGVEVLYTKIEQNNVGTWTAGGGNTYLPVGQYRAADQDHFSGTLRIQRNFWP